MTAKHNIEFNEALLDHMSAEQLAGLVSKVIQDKNHAPMVRSVLKSMVRSAVKSAAKAAAPKK